MSIVVIVGTLARVSIVGIVETQESNSQPSSAAAATRMVHHSIFGLLGNGYWVLVIGYWVLVVGYWVYRYLGTLVCGYIVDKVGIVGTQESSSQPSSAAAAAAGTREVHRYHTTTTTGSLPTHWGLYEFFAYFKERRDRGRGREGYS